MAPGYEFYIWVDSSSALLHKDSVQWFLDQLGSADIAVFPHGRRNTIQQEANYLKQRLKRNCPYVTPRYENELVDEHMREIEADKGYTDDKLYHSVAFAYRLSDKIREAMHLWWYGISRYHIVDQLTFPYALWKAGCKVNVIDIVRGYHHPQTPYLTHMRYRVK
jgi:hypothetical protein